MVRPAHPDPVREIDIVGTRVAACSFDEAVSELLQGLTAGARRRVHFATVHSVVEATRDPRLRQAFDSAFTVYTDGMPLVWLARRRGARNAERVCGPDVMVALADRGRSIGLRHFFYGGRDGVADGLAAQLQTRFPGLSVVGTYSPAGRAVGELESAQILDRINASGAQAVWVGLGSPKQEIWAANHESMLIPSLILPVGAAFDFHSGRTRRAPLWMQRNGLEWLFRLMASPRRLLRRYLGTNATFIALVVAEWLRSLGRGPASGHQ